MTVLNGDLLILSSLHLHLGRVVRRLLVVQLRVPLRDVLLVHMFLLCILTLLYALRYALVLL